MTTPPISPASFLPRTPGAPVPPRRPLPIAVGIAALAREVAPEINPVTDPETNPETAAEAPQEPLQRAAWALVTSEGLHLDGALPDGPGANVGSGLLVAIETLLVHPDLVGRDVMLFVADDDHREDIRALAPALGPINVHHERGSLGHVAAITVADAHPHLAPEPVTEVTGASSAASRPGPLPRIVIATDGSVGRGRGGKAAGGYAWVSEHGEHGFGASEDLKRPVAAEVRAIIAALQATEENQAVHILSDSRIAIKAVRYAHNPTLRADDPDYSWPVDFTKRLIGDLLAAVARRDITLSWVRGHLDPERVNPNRTDAHRRRTAVALNNAADRIAMASRRAMQMGLPDAVLAETVASIMVDTNRLLDAAKTTPETTECTTGEAAVAPTVLVTA